MKFAKKSERAIGGTMAEDLLQKTAGDFISKNQLLCDV